MRLRKAKESKAVELPNPSFKKFIRLDENESSELLAIFLKVKGSSEMFNEITDVPVGIIINIRSHFKNVSDQASIYDIVEVCRMLTGYSYKKLVSLSIHDLCKMYMFVINGLNKLSELERNLIRQMKARDVKAGIERLNKFSDLISLKTIADFYNEKLEDAELRPYKDCFSVWLFKKEEAEIEHNYATQNKPT